MSTNPYPVSSADISKPLSPCYVRFSSEVTYFTAHLLRAATIPHERELSFLCYSFGVHNRACNLQDFVTFSCTGFSLMTFEIKSSIPADTIHTREIFFVAGFEMGEESPVRIKNMPH